MQHLDRAIHLLKKYETELLPRLPYYDFYVADEVTHGEDPDHDKYDANCEVHKALMEEIDQRQD